MIQIQDFLEKKQIPLIDLRPLAMYRHGHIPGAIHVSLDRIRKSPEVLPKRLIRLLPSEKSDSLRSVRMYCQDGGTITQTATSILKNHHRRSLSLSNGYLAYRDYVDSIFRKPFQLIVLRGLAGSGKTELLYALQAEGEQVIDLEKLAQHRGSVFGHLGMPPQPAKEQFQNNLADRIDKLDIQRRIWVEEETENIGRVGIPRPLLSKLHQAPVVCLNVSLLQRTQRLWETYKRFSTRDLQANVQKLSSRLDKAVIKQIMTVLEKRELKQAIGKLLLYYDQAYQHQFKSQSVWISLDMDKNSIICAAQKLRRKKFSA